MRCEEVRDQLIVMVTEGREPLPSNPTARHIETCEGCQGELESLRKTWAFLGGLLEASPGPAVRARLIGRVRWLAFRDALLSLKGWKPSLPPAAIGALLSVGLSFLLPYDALVDFCRRAVGGLVPEPGVFLMAGLTYGLLPLAMVMWLSGRRRPVLWRMKSPLLFLVLISPYAIFQCLHFPGPALAGFLMGLSFGAFLGGVAVGQRWGNRMTCER